MDKNVNGPWLAPEPCTRASQDSSVSDFPFHILYQLLEAKIADPTRWGQAEKGSHIHAYMKLPYTGQNTGLELPNLGGGGGLSLYLLADHF